MNITSKHKLILVITLTILSTSLTFSEEKPDALKSPEPAPVPQEQKPEFKIEFSIDEDPKPFLDYELAQLSIRPTHVASVRIDWRHIIPSRPSVDEILKVPAAAFLSEQQKAFLKTGKAIRETIMDMGKKNHFGIEFIRGYNYYYIYGLSQDDIVTTAKVFTELFLINANADLQPAWSEYVKKYDDKYEELLNSSEVLKQQILDKRKLYAEAEIKAENAKKSERYDSTSIARDDILEFQKMLDTLNIELAGIRVRLEFIEMYKSASTSDSYHQKLQEMAIEQTIELSAAEAKKKEVLSLLSAAKDYYDAIVNFDKINREIRELESKQQTIEEQLNDVEKMISGSIYSFEIEPITSNLIYIRPLKVVY